MNATGVVCLFIVRCLTLITFLATLPLSAQSDGKGLPPFSETIPVRNGVINVGSGNLLLEFPIVTFPQRGGHILALKLVYNSKNSRAFGQSLGNKWLVESGWTLRESNLSGSIGYDYTSQWCSNPGITANTYTNFRFFDHLGTVHPFPGITLHSHSCIGSVSSASESAADQSNFFMSASVSGPGTGNVTATVWDRSGNKVAPVFKDNNGNSLTSSSDTLGRVPWTITGQGQLFTYIDVQDSSSGSVRYTLEYMDINVKTDFQVYSYAECCDSTVRVLKSITLPNNGGQYTFTYDAGATPGNYGQVQSMTLPSGGQISFGYTTYGNHTYRSRWISVFSTPDGSITLNPQCLGTSQISTLSCNPSLTHTITSPANTTIYTISDLTSLPTQIVIKEGSVTRASQTISYLVGGYPGGNNARPSSRVTTIYENGSPSLTTKTEYNYSTGSILSSIKEWDFYTGSPPANPKRRTEFTYLSPPSTNMIDRVTSKTIYDESGAQISRLEYFYDDYSAGLSMTDRGTGIVNHDDTYGTSYTPRGNLSRVKHWVHDPQNPANDHWVETKHAYDTLGNRVKTIDPLGHVTLYDYTDRWAAAGCVAANTFAYPTEVKNHLNHRNQTQYFPCTGLTQATRDENDILAGRWGEISAYDALGRLRSTAFADGGQALVDYDNIQHWIRNKQLRSTGAYIVNYSRLDGLGRVSRSELCEDGTDACAQSIKTDTTFDSVGRIASTTNPYRSTSDSTYGVTSFQYDAFDRPTTVTWPDNGLVTTSYSGNQVTVTDEAGKKRRTHTDALGRVQSVWEPDSGENFVFETSYLYDVLDNLVRVDQKGNDPNPANWRTRTYSYDSLSRLLKASNPESGTSSPDSYNRP